MNQKEIKKWLEEYATTLEKTIEEKITFKVGNCKCKYHKGDGEFTTIQGALFITTHNGNLFTIVDKKQQITDYFDIFGSDDVIEINEDHFTYILPPYKISISQIKRDIQRLRHEFIKCSGIWEWEDGGNNCVTVAERELALVKGIAKRYPFKYTYDPSNFNSSDTAEFRFTINQFNNNDVTDDNYQVVDAVASDFQQELIGMLSKLKEELEWLPPRFRMEFIDLICQCEQDAHSIRKNCEFFTDEIISELTEEENSEMFVVIK